MATKIDQLLRLLATVLRLVFLLHQEGEILWSESLLRIAIRIADSGSDEQMQSVARELLSVFGGMGSFNDLVLQNERGVSPENQELDLLRAEMFKVATEILR